MKKKGKFTKILEYYEAFILFVSYKLRTIKRDALGELVKCKSMKNSFEPNSLENPDISSFLAGFQ
jgi:hypothetical protein